MPDIEVGTTTPPHITILPHDDFVGLLNAALPGQQFSGVPGNYVPRGEQVCPHNAGWLLTMPDGATINWQLPAGGPASCFKFNGKSGSVSGGSWQTNGVLFGCYAQATISDISLAAGADKLAIIDQQFTNAGAGTTISGCTAGPTQSVTVFTTQSCAIHGNNIAGSYGEVGVRADSTNPGGVKPNNVIVTANTLGSVGGGNQKGCCELRELGTGCQFAGNICRDYLRCGQGSAGAPDEYAGNLLIIGNKWMNLPPTIQLYLMLMAGVTADVEANDFLVNATIQVAQISSPTKITFGKNRRHLNAAGIIPRAGLYNPIPALAGREVIDMGGNILVPFGQ